MDSPKPLLYIGGVLYEGAVRPVVGNHLLFDASGGYTGAAEIRVVFTKSQDYSAGMGELGIAKGSKENGHSLSREVVNTEKNREKSVKQRNPSNNDSTCGAGNNDKQPCA